MTISSWVSMRGVVVLATVAVASCELPHSLQQVKTSNPSVTYEYRGDQELLQAQQNAVTFCNQYGSAPRPARFTTGSNGQSNNVGLRMRSESAGSRAASAGVRSQSHLQLSDGPGAAGRVVECPDLLHE
jgi:hypothetical protein